MGQKADTLKKPDAVIAQAVDVITHFLLPYVGALAALGLACKGTPDRAKVAWAASFGLGGFAPDLDSILDPLSSRVDTFYWLQHRGASHSLLGAPLFALALLGVVSRLARRWPHLFGLFSWRRSLVVAAALGSLTHLLLDGITYAGVPLWWPLEYGRVSLQFYGYIVLWIWPLGAAALLLHAFGKLSHRSIVAVGLVLVVILAAVAGVRLATRPDEPGTLVFPRPAETEGTVLRPHTNGTWEGFLHESDGAGPSIWFEDGHPPEARAAVELARGTNAFKGFLMGQFGPVTTRAQPIRDGWNVTFTDVAQRIEALSDPRWTPTQPYDAWGYASFDVVGDKVTATHQGW